MISMYLHLNITAWLSHNNSWKVKAIRPFFFFDWRIKRSQESSKKSLYSSAVTGAQRNNTKIELCSNWANASKQDPALEVSCQAESARSRATLTNGRETANSCQVAWVLSHSVAWHAGYTKTAYFFLLEMCSNYSQNGPGPPGSRRNC